MVEAVGAAEMVGVVLVTESVDGTDRKATSRISIRDNRTSTISRFTSLTPGIGLEKMISPAMPPELFAFRPSFRRMTAPAAFLKTRLKGLMLSPDPLMPFAKIKLSRSYALSKVSLMTPVLEFGHARRAASQGYR